MSEIAEKKFPYETEKECKDEFTRNLRNGIIDLLRQTFDLGMEYKEKELMKDAIEGYVARDKNMGLFLYKEEPVLNKRFGGFWQGERSLCIPRRFFTEQKWTDNPLNVKVIIIKE